MTPQPTRRQRALGIAAITVALALLGLVAAAPVAWASSAHKEAACRPFADIKAAEHREAVRRETAINNLLASLSTRRDPFHLNAGQQSTLQNAAGSITALDQQVQTGCYATLAAVDAAVRPLYTDYRVYWLRAPQTAVVEAADELGAARAALGTAASRLAPLVADNTAAKASLDAMNAALAAADAKLGVAPAPGATIAAVARLVPAADMTANDQAINAARADLAAVATSLTQANADAHAALRALRS